MLLRIRWEAPLDIRPGAPPSAQVCVGIWSSMQARPSIMKWRAWLAGSCVSDAGMQSSDRGHHFEIIRGELARHRSEAGERLD